MLTQPIRKTFDIGDGRQVTIETGRLARQADGAVPDSGQDRSRSAIGLWRCPIIIGHAPAVGFVK